ncbi:MAG: Na+/H+ antiporter subunit E [Spirochaetales bacterium]|nr:Na+/H+ antiporter subunit E [Spirochaetales bacterium]
MEISRKWNITRVILTTVYLFAAWLLFTGSFAPYSLFLGVLFSLVVALLTYRYFIEEYEAARRSLLPRLYNLLIFLVIILWRIYAASFRVAWQVLSGRINPRIVHFRTRLKYDLARAILANAITLTPGTVTLDLDDDHLIVHWLDARTSHSHYAGKLIKEDFERWLRRIWM